MFFVNSVLLGVGLSMDAFSVSLANGLNEQQMRHGKMCAIAAVFAVFQGLMPLLGWVCVHTVLQYFEALEKFVPFVALALLCFVGIKMIVEGVRNKGKQETAVVGVAALLVQGVATSIDALSVGFTIASYNLAQAAICVAIIAAVTFGICLLGVFLGKKFGTKLADKATIFGGAILVLIGLEIFLTGILA